MKQQNFNDKFLGTTSVTTNLNKKHLKYHVPLTILESLQK